MNRSILSQQFVPILAVALIVILLPLFFSTTYFYRLGAVIFIHALAVVGLNILMGFAGQVSLGHAAFFGIGAYSVAILPVQFGMPPGFAIVAGIIGSCGLALVVGRPVLSLKGYYLAMATLGLGLLVSMVLTNEVDLTGGPNGMSVPKLDLFGWRISRPSEWYWISGCVLIGGVIVASNLYDSPVGRALRAIHDSEIASSILGVDVARFKLAAFVISAGYASLAGSFLSLLDGFVTPDTSSFLKSIEFVVMVVVGGLGSILGSLVGAAIIVLLPQILSVLHDYEQIFFGLIMILLMMFLPNGVVPSLRRCVQERSV